MTRDGLTPLTFGLITRGVSEWPAYVLKNQQYDHRHGLDVTLVPAGSPVGSLQQVAAGEVDVGETTFDGVIAARQAGADVRFVAASQLYYRGVLVARPGIKSLGELRGKRIFADAKNPLYLLMREHLRSEGISDSDWMPVEPLSSPERLAALQAGAIDATILPSPFEFRAERAGFPWLADLGEVYPSYGLTAIAATDGTINGQLSALKAFTAAYGDAINWLLAAANRDAALALLVEWADLPSDDADAVYRLLIETKRGFATDAIVPPRYVEGVQEALVLGKRLESIVRAEDLCVALR